jgi:hypothetical protein
MDKLTASTEASSYRAEGPQDFEPTPLQRLGIWLSTNAKLADNFTDVDVDRVIARLNACGIGEDIEGLNFTAPDTTETLCEDCGEVIVADSSPGVWVHDPEALGDIAYDLNESHAARPPEESLT